jgi:Protein kinase domain/Concanavalin A-like lectin/glucanases superfamily
MPSEEWAEVEQLYHAAVRLHPSARETFLENACAGNTALRKQIESLLAYDEQATPFLESPLLGGAAKWARRAPVELRPGEIFGHFEIISLVGAGGMGEVYRATDLRLDREVALKVLSGKLATRPTALARFEREAKAVAALCHPVIVAIHEFGYEHGIPFAATELLEGESLRATLERGALPWPRAVEIAVAIIGGLEAVHAKGITHRDLKPENIFITADGRVKILDFGLAHMKHAVTQETPAYITEPGVVMGTVGYMSPEQTEGKLVDARSDIFSFGAVLYEMVTGRQPFQGDSKISTMAAILHLEPKLMRAFTPGVPSRLEDVVVRCIRKRPNDRIQNAADVRAALARCAEARRRELPWTAPRGRAGAAIGAAVLLAVGALALNRSTHFGRKPVLGGRVELAAKSVPFEDAGCRHTPHGIMGWWPGESNTKDVVGRVNGTAENGVTFAPGKVGKAFNFDGVAAHVLLGDTPLFAPAAITVEFWMNARSVRPDYTHVAARWGHLYSRWGNSWLFNIDTDRRVYFCVQTELSRVEACAATKSAIRTNTWYHVAGTYDSGGSGIRIYLDGRLEGEQEHHGRLQAAQSTAAIGCKYADAACLYPFNGLVDEFSIFERALLPEEIARLFAAGSGGKCRPAS